MSAELLKWVACGLVAAVLASTLWMAHAIHPEHATPRLLLAQAAAAPAPAASAVTARR